MLNPNNYIVVNIWTSEKNKAVPGANVGHISISTPLEPYISFWPGDRKPHKDTPSLAYPIVRFVRRYAGVRPADYKEAYMDDCLAEAFSENDYEEITNISQLKKGHVLCKIDEDSGECEVIDTFPEFIKENERILAVKPCEATVRIVLYGLNVGDLNEKFKELKKSVTGWRMIGSNMFSRIGANSEESCASFVYRCLCEAGMYDNLASGLSSQTSSIVDPDTLLRHVIAAKDHELKKHPETNTQEFFYKGESDFEALKQRFKELNLKANAEEDKLPKSQRRIFGRGCALV